VTGYEFNASWRGILIYALVLTSPSKINFLRRGEWRNFVLLINYCQSWRTLEALNGKIIENHYGLPQLREIKIKIFFFGISGALRALIMVKKSQKRIAKNFHMSLADPLAVAKPVIAGQLLIARFLLSRHFHNFPRGKTYLETDTKCSSLTSRMDTSGVRSTNPSSSCKSTNSPGFVTACKIATWAQTN
jgi:hypothetical protein